MTDNIENFKAFKSEILWESVASHHTGDLGGEGSTSPSRGKHGWRFTARIQVGRQLGIQQIIRNFYKNEDISESVCSFDLGPIFVPPLG